MTTKKILNKDGFLFLFKEKGYSSFYYVKQIRKILGVKKVGHAGTLDPLAEGLLIIAIGNATKFLEYLIYDNKNYIFTIQFGNNTTTDDSEGDIIETTNNIPNKEKILSIIPEYTGTIEQTPPIYSAIKVNGQRAYKLAREGKNVNISTRAINIYNLELINFNNNQAKFNVHCSKGTYVRSLARDIAKSCNSLGHVVYLHRNKIGKYDVSNTITLENIKKIIYNENDFLENILIPIDNILDDISALSINDDLFQDLKHGRKIFFSEKYKDGLYRIYNNNKFYGLINIINNNINKRKLINI